MRGRVTQDHQRLELGQRLHGGGAFHLLRLIENQDRSVGGDHVDGPSRLEVVQLVIDTPVIGTPGIERLNVHHHHVDAGIRRKALQLVQPLGVVDEEARLLAVALGEMIRRDLQGLLHPLANGDGRHHDDELRPAVTLVQLENSLDVAVGLARTGFHLHVQMNARGGQRLLAVGGLDRHPRPLGIEGGELAERLRQRQVLQALHLLHIFQQLAFAQGQLGIAKAIFIEGARLIALARVDAIAQAGTERLPGETIGHGIDGMGLVGLNLESEFHVFAAAFLSAALCTQHLAESCNPLIYK